MKNLNKMHHYVIDDEISDEEEEDNSQQNISNSQADASNKLGGNRPAREIVFDADDL